MARISLVIEDTVDGDFSLVFMGDSPLPENLEEYTEAQKYAVALHKALVDAKGE